MSLVADGNTFTPIDLPADTPRDLVINPNAPQRAALHVTLIRTYSDYVESDAVIAEGKSFLAAFPTSPSTALQTASAPTPAASSPKPERHRAPTSPAKPAATASAN